MPIFVQIHPNPSQSLRQSFESLAVALGCMPGMYFEMDGSFVWVDHRSKPVGQMDGMVYDRDGCLEYVEIKGNCTPDQWLTLCRAVCGVPISQSRDAEADDLTRSYSTIEKMIRVHFVTEGGWTSAREIASRLAANLG